MAVVADRVIVELEAKIDRYEANVRRAQRQFEGAMGGIGRSAGATNAIVGRAMGGIGVALAGVSALAVARQFLAMVDGAKKMDAQLKLATQQVGSFGQAQDDVRRIAELTRNDLESTAALYASFSRGAAELGINQAQVATITETVGKAFKVSGTSAADSAAAIRQLSQAFASGVLRGDEFNSIMENAPRLSRLLADSMGVPQGALRKLAEEGELTADKLVAAFSDRRFLAGLNEEFAQMPVTFDDAMTLLYNSAQITFSEFDRGGGFSQMIAQFVTDASDGMGDIGDAAQETGIAVRSAFEGLGDAFEPLVDGAMSAFGTIFSEAATLRSELAATLGLIDDVANAANAGRGPVEKWIDRNVWGMGDSRSNLRGRFERGYDRAERSRRLQIGEQNVRDLFAGRDVFGNRINRAPTRSSRPATSGGGGGGGGRRRTGGRARVERSPLNPEAFAREEQQLNDQILRLKADALQGAERTAEAVRQGAEIELTRIKADREFAEKEIQNDERYTADQKKKLIALQNTISAHEAVGVMAAREQELAELALRETERRNRTLQEQSRYEQDALNERLRLATTRAERAEIENRLLTIAEEQEKADLELLLATNKNIDAERARTDLAASQAARREGSRRDNRSPLERYADQFDDDRANLGDRAQELVIEEIEYVRSKMADAISDAIGTKDPLINGLLQLLIDQVIMRPLARALEQASSGQGGGGSLLGSIFSGIGKAVGTIFAPAGTTPGRASGGHVRAGSVYRINETGVEGWQAPQSGKIIPLGRMRGGQGGGTVVQQTFVLDARYGITTPELLRHVEQVATSKARQAGSTAYRAGVQSVVPRLAEHGKLGT